MLSDTNQTFIKVEMYEPSSFLFFDNITIGSLKTQLIKILGEPQLTDSSYSIYWDKNNTIGIFKIINNRIEWISYGRYNELIDTATVLSFCNYRKHEKKESFFKTVNSDSIEFSNKLYDDFYFVNRKINKSTGVLLNQKGDTLIIIDELVNGENSIELNKIDKGIYAFESYDINGLFFRKIIVKK